MAATKTFVDTNAGSLVEVDENKAVSLPCSGKGTHDVVTWFKGPFHRPDNENFTHSEVGDRKSVIKTEQSYGSNLSGRVSGLRWKNLSGLLQVLITTLVISGSCLNTK